MNIDNKKIFLKYLHSGTVEAEVFASLNVIYADFKGISPINMKDAPLAKLKDFLDAELFDNDYYGSDFRLRESWLEICEEITEWLKEDISRDYNFSVHDSMFQSDYFHQTMLLFFTEIENRPLKSVITEELLHLNGISYIREFIKSNSNYIVTIGTEKDGVLQFSKNDTEKLENLLHQIESGLICQNYFVSVFFRVSITLPFDQELTRVSAIRFNHLNKLVSEVSVEKLQELFSNMKKNYPELESDLKNSILMDVRGLFLSMNLKTDFSL